MVVWELFELEDEEDASKAKSVGLFDSIDAIEHHLWDTIGIENVNKYPSHSMFDGKYLSQQTYRRGSFVAEMRHVST